MGVPMKFGEPCPNCAGTASEHFESIRSEGGPVSVGHFAADTFTVFSQFEAFVCQKCGYTEFYRKAS